MNYSSDLWKSPPIAVTLFRSLHSSDPALVAAVDSIIHDVGVRSHRKPQKAQTKVHDLIVVPPLNSHISNVIRKRMFKHSPKFALEAMSRVEWHSYHGFVRQGKMSLSKPYFQILFGCMAHQQQDARACDAPLLILRSVQKRQFCALLTMHCLVAHDQYFPY